MPTLVSIFIKPDVEILVNPERIISVGIYHQKGETAKVIINLDDQLSYTVPYTEFLKLHKHLSIDYAHTEYKRPDKEL